MKENNVFVFFWFLSGFKCTDVYFYFIDNDYLQM